MAPPSDGLILKKASRPTLAKTRAETMHGGNVAQIHNRQLNDLQNAPTMLPATKMKRSAKQI
jgi:hypothetical protein